GLQLHNGATVIAHERRLLSTGSGGVSIHFVDTPYFPAKTFDLHQRWRVADLTALRRYGARRASSPFPAEPHPLPIVDRGSLVLVGGGGMPRGLLTRFVQLAGGRDASIVVIPISMPDPLPDKDGMARQLRRLGAGKVTVLRGRTPADADRVESLDALRTATGIWFGGGRQWRFVDAYEGTRAVKFMRDVLARGGVIGGSSAGATIQGDYLARGNPLGPDDIMAEGYEQGFAFLPGVAVDQHFSQRRRQPDMAALMQRYPSFLGIGLDETTGLVVQGCLAEVVGEHRVHFYDAAATTSDAPRIVSARAGQWYDLVARRLVTPPEATANVPAGPDHLADASAQ
ncbi:MAG: cyanophycinase, partial [Planctomycetales bacterium]|nr:cyanophycinase [Planctomycetales bacterium]